MTLKYAVDLSLCTAFWHDRQVSTKMAERVGRCHDPRWHAAVMLSGGVRHGQGNREFGSGKSFREASLIEIGSPYNEIHIRKPEFCLGETL